MKKTKRFATVALAAIVMTTSVAGASVMPVSAKTLAESWEHGTQKLCGYQFGSNVWTKKCWPKTVGYTNKKKYHFCDASIGKGSSREAHSRKYGHGNVNATCTSNKRYSSPDDPLQGWLFIPTAYARYGWGK